MYIRLLFRIALILLFSRHSHKYFRNGSVVFPAEDVPAGYEREKQLVYLNQMRRLEEYVAPEDHQFLDLLEKLFEYDPHKRITGIAFAFVLCTCSHQYFQLRRLWSIHFLIVLGIYIITIANPFIINTARSNALFFHFCNSEFVL